MESSRERGVPASRQDSVEIILVDDGSDGAIADEIKKIAGGLAVVRIPHAGAAIARNRGFAESRGEFVFFCDADVILRGDCLEMMAAALADHPGAAYAYSDYQLGWKKMPARVFDGEALKKINYISTMSLLRRADFCGFDGALKRFQDWDLWLTMLERGKTGAYISEALFCAHPARFGMSKWRPGFWYKLFPWAKSVREYNQAREIVMRKHGL